MIELIEFLIFQGKDLFGSVLLTDADQVAFEPGSLKGLNSISNTLSFNQGCQLTVSTISLERAYSGLIKARSLNGFLALIQPSACFVSLVKLFLRVAQW